MFKEKPQKILIPKTHLQDSGFSDVETSPTVNKKNITNTSEDDDDDNQRSPSASSKLATPPTVIRRPKIPIYEEIASVKRLSFSAPSSPIALEHELQSQIDGINFNTTSPMQANDVSRSSCRSCKLKRSRVITKSSRSPKSLNSSLDDSFDKSLKPSAYNNETVYFGAGESIMEEKSLMNTTPEFPTGTSTPKMKRRPIVLENLLEYLPSRVVYKNHLLNGNFASVQSWIEDLGSNVCSEIMSTLQSKSIEAESSILTSTLAFKMTKGLQVKVFLLQKEFEKVEQCSDDFFLLSLIQSLTSLMIEFVVNQEPKKVLYFQRPKYYKKLSDNLQSIREMATDLKRLAGKVDLDDLEDYPIHEDVQLIKRYFLITVRIIFKLLVSVIAENIEHAHNDMVLRSNITHMANLQSNEYSNLDGFSSLHDALISNSIVRVLLLVCIESKYDWTRALALRTLSVVCTSEETIQQFEINSGFEILRDTIVDSQRSEQEIKEGISCLAALTGPWQRSNENNFKDLRDYIEDFIEGVTKLVGTTESSQTMLICVAVLNNLSRLDTSSVYSLISNQSIFTISCGFEKQKKGEYTIFLFDQFISLIFNMSLNRKSHYHLTNRPILGFIYKIFLAVHNENYEGAAKTKAQQNVIQNVQKIMKNLAILEENHDVESIMLKISEKLSPMDITSSTSFNISKNAKNVTKISITKQSRNNHETFF